MLNKREAEALTNSITLITEALNMLKDAVVALNERVTELENDK